MSTAAEPNVVASDGVIVRVVREALGYVTAPDEQRTLAFVPEAIAGYAGEPLHELGITEGREVKLWWQPESGTVTRVEIPSLKHVGPEQKSDGTGHHDPFEAMKSAPASESLPVVRQQPSPSTSQFELHPDRQAALSSAARRALPRATRNFGKLVDTSNLRPGDLLLSREQEPDRISQLIAEVQAEGGYATQDGRWTHAAMYVGDDQSVIEATFDDLASGGNVRLTSLDEYCDGKNILRFRRSKYVPNDATGWRLCVRAMSRLTQPYSFGLIAQIWYNVVVRKQGFYSSEKQHPTTQAIVCSTLYADAYNEALRRSLGEVNGACVPAWLSASDEFVDVEAEWIAVV
jgi:hypothetical protein